MPVTKLTSGLPSRTMPQAEFDAAAEKLMAELPPWAVEVSALEDNVNAKEASTVVAAEIATNEAEDAVAAAIIATTKAGEASDSATAAAASATAAQGVQLTGTSTTSLTIGTGAKVFVTQAGRQWPAGVPCIAINPADATQFMAGTFGTYSGTSLTINVTRVDGVGEVCANWNISTAGDQSAPGQTASNTQFTPVPVAALDLDLSLGNYFTKTINANSTFTFSNAPAGGFSFTLRLTHTSGVIALPASVVAPNSQIPTLLTGKVHLFMFATDDGGTTWRMAINPNYPS